MKLVLLNLKYSPNLGDGIIAECFEAALRASHPDIEVVSCDIAGRAGYGDGLNRSRGLVFSLLDHLPRAVRRQLVSLGLRPTVQFMLRAHYRSALKDADLALLTGGQVIADTDLNFPLKIAAAAGEARAGSVPLGIYGVGVAAHFSKAGLKLFRSAFDPSLFGVYLRDEVSRRHWDALFAPPAGTLVNDPGFLASEIWPHQPLPFRARKLIGVGITNPSTLNLHAVVQGPAHVAWRAFFADLCEMLADQGFDVQLFTNGPYDDRVFATSVFHAVPDTLKLAGHVLPPPDLRVPADLAGLLASLDGVIGHRLHAHVVASSYGIPTVGLAWDPKLEAFFTASGRNAYMIAEVAPEAHTVVGTLQRALQEGIEEESRRAMLGATRLQIDALGGVLKLAASRTVSGIGGRRANIIVEAG